MPALPGCLPISRPAHRALNGSPPRSIGAGGAQPAIKTQIGRGKDPADERGREMPEVLQEILNNRIANTYAIGPLYILKEIIIKCISIIFLPM